MKSMRGSAVYGKEGRMVYNNVSEFKEGVTELAKLTNMQKRWVKDKEVLRKTNSASKENQELLKDLDPQKRENRPKVNTYLAVKEAIKLGKMDRKLFEKLKYTTWFKKNWKEVQGKMNLRIEKMNWGKDWYTNTNEVKDIKAFMKKGTVWVDLYVFELKSKDKRRTVLNKMAIGDKLGAIKIKQKLTTPELQAGVIRKLLEDYAQEKYDDVKGTKLFKAFFRSRKVADKQVVMMKSPNEIVADFEKNKKNNQNLSQWITSWQPKDGATLRPGINKYFDLMGFQDQYEMDSKMQGAISKSYEKDHIGRGKELAHERLSEEIFLAIERELIVGPAKNLAADIKRIAVIAAYVTSVDQVKSALLSGQIYAITGGGAPGTTFATTGGRPAYDKILPLLGVTDVTGVKFVKELDTNFRLLDLSDKGLDVRLEHLTGVAMGPGFFERYKKLFLSSPDRNADMWVKDASLATTKMAAKCLGKLLADTGLSKRQNDARKLFLQGLTNEKSLVRGQSISILQLISKNLNERTKGIVDAGQLHKEFRTQVDKNLADTVSEYGDRIKEIFTDPDQPILVKAITAVFLFMAGKFVWKNLIHPEQANGWQKLAQLLAAGGLGYMVVQKVAPEFMESLREGKMRIENTYLQAFADRHEIKGKSMSLLIQMHDVPIATLSEAFLKGRTAGGAIDPDWLGDHISLGKAKYRTPKDKLQARKDLFNIAGHFFKDAAVDKTGNAGATAREGVAIIQTDYVQGKGVSKAGFDRKKMTFGQIVEEKIPVGERFTEKNRKAIVNVFEKGVAVVSAKVSGLVTDTLKVTERWGTKELDYAKRYMKNVAFPTIGEYAEGAWEWTAVTARYLGGGVAEGAYIVWEGGKLVVKGAGRYIKEGSKVLAKSLQGIINDLDRELKLADQMIGTRLETEAELKKEYPNFGDEFFACIKGGYKRGRLVPIKGRGYVAAGKTKRVEARAVSELSRMEAFQEAKEEAMWSIREGLKENSKALKKVKAKVKELRGIAPETMISDDDAVHYYTNLCAQVSGVIEVTQDGGGYQKGEFLVFMRVMEPTTSEVKDWLDNGAQYRWSRDMAKAKEIKEIAGIETLDDLLKEFDRRSKEDGEWTWGSCWKRFEDVWLSKKSMYREVKKWKNVPDFVRIKLLTGAGIYWVKDKIPIPYAYVWPDEIKNLGTKLEHHGLMEHMKDYLFVDSSDYDRFGKAVMKEFSDKGYTLNQAFEELFKPGRFAALIQKTDDILTVRKVENRMDAVYGGIKDKNLKPEAAHIQAYKDQFLKEGIKEDVKKGLRKKLYMNFDKAFKEFLMRYGSVQGFKNYVRKDIGMTQKVDKEGEPTGQWEMPKQVEAVNTFMAKMSKIIGLLNKAKTKEGINKEVLMSTLLEYIKQKISNATKVEATKDKKLLITLKGVDYKYELSLMGDAHAVKEKAKMNLKKDGWPTQESVNKAVAEKIKTLDGQGPKDFHATLSEIYAFVEESDLSKIKNMIVGDKGMKMSSSAKQLVAKFVLSGEKIQIHMKQLESVPKKGTKLSYIIEIDQTGAFIARTNKGKKMKLNMGDEWAKYNLSLHQVKEFRYTSAEKLEKYVAINKKIKALIAKEKDPTALVKYLLGDLTKGDRRGVIKKYLNEGLCLAEEFKKKMELKKKIINKCNASGVKPELTEKQITITSERIEVRLDRKDKGVLYLEKGKCHILSSDGKKSMDLGKNWDNLAVISKIDNLTFDDSGRAKGFETCYNALAENIPDKLLAYFGNSDEIIKASLKDGLSLPDVYKKEMITRAFRVSGSDLNVEKIELRDKNVVLVLKDWDFDIVISKDAVVLQNKKVEKAKLKLKKDVWPSKDSIKEAVKNELSDFSLMPSQFLSFATASKKIFEEIKDDVKAVLKKKERFQGLKDAIMEVEMLGAGKIEVSLRNKNFKIVLDGKSINVIPKAEDANIVNVVINKNAWLTHDEALKLEGMTNLLTKEALADAVIKQKLKEIFLDNIGDPKNFYGLFVNEHLTLYGENPKKLMILRLRKVLMPKLQHLGVVNESAVGDITKDPSGLTNIKIYPAGTTSKIITVAIAKDGNVQLTKEAVKEPLKFGNKWPTPDKIAAYIAEGGTPMEVVKNAKFIEHLSDVTKEKLKASLSDKVKPLEIVGIELKDEKLRLNLKGKDKFFMELSADGVRIKPTASLLNKPQTIFAKDWLTDTELTKLKGMSDLYTEAQLVNEINNSITKDLRPGDLFKKCQEVQKDFIGLYEKTTGKIQLQLSVIMMAKISDLSPGTVRLTSGGEIEVKLHNRDFKMNITNAGITFKAKSGKSGDSINLDAWPTAAQIKALKDSPALIKEAEFKSVIDKQFNNVDTPAELYKQFTERFQKNVISLYPNQKDLIIGKFAPLLNGLKGDIDKSKIKDFNFERGILKFKIKDLPISGVEIRADGLYITPTTTNTAIKLSKWPKNDDAMMTALKDRIDKTKPDFAEFVGLCSLVPEENLKTVIFEKIGLSGYDFGVQIVEKKVTFTFKKNGKEVTLAINTDRKFTLNIGTSETEPPTWPANTNIDKHLKSTD